MNKISRIICALAFAAFAFLALNPAAVFAQLDEPEVRELPDPKTPVSEDLNNRWSVDIMLNNFGFGVGGQYGRVLGPYTELTFKAGVTGIRDVSELTFQDFFTGNQLIPNKYNRAIGFPILVGLKKRIFAKNIQDNFRLFLEGAAGPSLSFLYPYVNDVNNDGFRTFQATEQGFLVPVETVNDFFSGWKEGETQWGLNGEIKIGADIGSGFKNQTTVEIGYFFYYFDPGLQIMEPYRPTEYNDDGVPVEETKEPFFDAQKLFGTPQIKITFGGMW